MGKFLNKKDLNIFLQKKSNKKVVFTNGCFDILHPGHIHLLRKAKLLGDILIVGLNSDKSVKILKGNNRPINKELDRIKLLSSLRYIDYVTVFNEETPLNLIKQIIPNVLVKGSDYDSKNIVGVEFVIENGGAVEIIKLKKDFSTTKLINNFK
tara:strand:+ start:24517 stop:24975 length:459 start_codon:yes stop_codon:yes gene_type:complete